MAYDYQPNNYQQDNYQQNNYQPNSYQPNYYQPQYGAPYSQDPRTINNGPKPTVLYIIAGVIAVLAILFIFLPQFTYSHPGMSAKSYNVFGIKEFSDDVTKFSGSSKKDKATASAALSGVAIGLFLPPAGLCVAWAILSFMRKRAAGILGVIASGYYVISSLIWLGMIAGLSEAVKSGKYVETFDMTPVPVFLLLLTIAGIPVSIIQIVKKKYL